MNILATSTVFINNQQFQQINGAIQKISFAVGQQPIWNTQIFGVMVGALIGITPFLYQIYHDRPIIKVKIDGVWLPSSVSTIVSKGFSATIYNSGRRSIILDKFYLRFKDNSALVFIAESSYVGGVSGLPKKLEENANHRVVISAGTIARDLLQKQSYPTLVCFSDALGNEYAEKTDDKFWESVFSSKKSDHDASDKV